LLDELGFDAVSSSENGTDLHVSLDRLCPNGVDVYFDNVGGAVSDAVMRSLNTRARVVVCGQISQDNLEHPAAGPRLPGHLIAREAKLEDFQVAGYADRFSEGLEQLATWLAEGRLRYREQIAVGIEAAPQAFIGMLREKNEGKQLVQLSSR
jgi:NADPH-dependent curcumin reductase CurA